MNLVKRLGYNDHELPCFHFFDPDPWYYLNKEFECKTFNKDINIEGIENLI